MMPRLMRHTILGLILFSLPAFGAHPLNATAPVGYQAFNLSFDDVAERIPELARRGYTDVQISPPQKSLDSPYWWARYQPVDFGVIEGLGNEAQFRRMTETARQNGVRIIVDTILNHMANDHSFPDLVFPQFGPSDFHFPATRPCVENWDDRYQATQYWLCFGPDGALPDLDTSSTHVRQVHREYLEKLIALGASGFRIDAAKHVELPYFESVLKALPGNPWVYGEVVSGRVSEEMEYSPVMDVTDFTLLGSLLGAFNDGGGDLRSLGDTESRGASLPGSSAVVFARNHDTAMSSDFYNFRDARDVALANAFLFARGQGTPFIYRDDFQDPVVQSGLDFYRRMNSRTAHFADAASYCGACNQRDLLLIERGNLGQAEGLAIINKADHWFEQADVSAPGMMPGCYRELSFGFEVEVAAGTDGIKRFSQWGSAAQSGLHLGPKTALFLTWEREHCDKR